MKDTLQKRAKAGDIFAMKTQNNMYLFGRIMLDFELQCIRPKLINERSPLWLRDSYLIQAYDLISDSPSFKKAEVRINGIIMDSQALENDIWKIINHQPVDPREIEFNEYLATDGSHLSLIRGEIKLATSLPSSEYYNYMILGGIKRSTYFDQALLPYLGITEMGMQTGFKDSDIRMNTPEIKNKIYGALLEKNDLPYYDISLKHGFDVARFFDKKDNSSNTEFPSDKISFLEGIMWAFDGVEYNSLALFEKSLKEYNEQLGIDFSDAKMCIPEILLLVEYIDEKDRDKEIKFNLKPDNKKYFTEVELLYKINNKITKKIADLDKHFFEGLSLLQKAETGKPALYLINLGS